MRGNSIVCWLNRNCRRGLLAWSFELLIDLAAAVLVLAFLTLPLSG
jgi:hypothetical protein